MKQLIGITLIITLIFHGLVLSYFSIAEDNHDASEAYFSDSFIGELPDDLPMLSLSDQLVVVGSKAPFLGGSLHNNIIAVYAFHFEKYVNSIIKISQKIDLIFDIKALKYPTHYFW
ncbi:hypothetical protein [Aquiflexum sp.]|uniref:hypothetical protein n=1 Tax=Aquiflexum sp. TaxID=1872584 RepID=UPI003593C8A3